MNAHLLALTVGPVQEFIAAARRTRDLWFGSYLLSEISKATAKAVRDHGGNLIFPAPGNAADLKPDSPLNVANVILAELPDRDPKVIEQQAKEAAQARWRQFAERVFQNYQRVIQDDIWGDQVNDVIEFYAAWVVSKPETYKHDRTRLMRLLAGRKNCRDFLPAKGRAGVPKSSLDGLRESVLRKRHEWPQEMQSRLRVSEGEQLDSLGLVKRAATGTRPYPSVARVAADPWLRGIGPARLAPLVAACDNIPAVRRDSPVYHDFPFEGTVVYPNRHSDLQKEGAATDEQLGALRKALNAIGGEPNPYLAVLVADGDKMGAALSALSSADEHRAFSRKLAGFAAEANTIIGQSRGVLVFAGGDDVLAFVPVDTVLECARALYTTFYKSTEMTLSVGVAIAHFMEPLEDLLGYGRTAESHAKNPRAEDRGQESRDGLAVHLVKRGGGPVAVRANWSDDLDRRLTELANHLNDGAIPGRVAADLHQIAQVYDDWPPGSVADAIQRDTLRVIAAKQPRRASALDQVRELVRARVTDAGSLRRLADELLVARQIAVALRQATGRGAAEEIPA